MVGALVTLSSAFLIRVSPCGVAVLRVEEDGWVRSHELFARLSSVGLGPVLNCIKPKSGTAGLTRARFNFQNLFAFVKAPLAALEAEPGEKRGRKKKRGLILPPKRKRDGVPCKYGAQFPCGFLSHDSQRQSARRVPPLWQMKTPCWALPGVSSRVFLSLSCHA